MEPFQRTVALVAVVFLILFFVGFGLLMRNNESKQEFPPTAQSCPEYWKTDTTTPGKVYCVQPNASSVNYGTEISGNTTNIHGYIQPNSGNKRFDTLDGGWGGVGMSGKCEKQQFAELLGIQWDGITNFNSCPKATT